MNVSQIKRAAIVLLSALPLLLHAQEHRETHKVELNIGLTCPPSRELQTWVDHISALQGQTLNWEQLAQALIDSADELVLLLETEKVSQMRVSVSQEVEVSESP